MLITIQDTYNTFSGQAEAFEKSYIGLRQKEGRMCTDEELAGLPEVSSHHMHAGEWAMRRESCLRLKKYLSRKTGPLNILEAGCGNGWLSHRLAEIPHSSITGTDINHTELYQAKRVFSHVPNLTFLYGGLDAAALREKKFDQVVFASSIQYFVSLKDSVEKALDKLNKNGELHILDSPLYRPQQLRSAGERTRAHFLATGFPEMAESYYHHNIEDLRLFHFSIMYAPGIVNKYFFGRQNPFPWVRIKKK